MPETSLPELLAAAVAAVGGTARPGQQHMAQAVAEAIASGEHLLVQAGTGTGKSLAYLVPALQHARATAKPVVVATATLALQAQIVERELPRLGAALEAQLGPTSFGVLKGRRNYLCEHKMAGGFPPEEQALFEVPREAEPEPSAEPGWLGQQILRLRTWAEKSETGDRDELVPGVSDRAWQQVSVSAQECLGSSCPVFSDCYVERARAAARTADIVVTNHAMLAIDAFEGRQLLPEHDLVIVDEGHELVDRVTSSITGQLSPQQAERVSRQMQRYADGSALSAAGAQLALALTGPAGKFRDLPEPVAQALAQLRDAARIGHTELKAERGEPVEAHRQVARAGLDELFDLADRLLAESEHDVRWLSQDPRRGPVLHVAPLSVAGLLREGLFPERTVVLTSATLELGGSFTGVAGSVGLLGESAPAWQGLDVGSPFDYPRQAILYCAGHLPQPGRDGPGGEMLDELAELMIAAGGRTLGLFSSRKAANAAADALRERLDLPILCQGDDQLNTLVRNFAADPQVSLFGTLSLWQGVDVPGNSCQLVVIDRIPFPRPDDPLMSARTAAVAAAGGNGFMAVSAHHAALRLAQGAGRLIRSSTDKGVVAVLDPRLVTARYGGFLISALPALWRTTDREVALGSLRRLAAEADSMV